MSKFGPALPAPPNPTSELRQLDRENDWNALGERAWEVLDRRRMNEIFPDNHKSEFQRYLEVHARSSPRYRREVFIGLEPNTNRPLFVPRKLFSHHSYVLGATGSGKTTQALAQLLIQLACPWPDVDGEQHPAPPILIIDLKQNGDRYLRSLAERIAASRGQKLRFFSVDPDYESLHFDPLFCLRSIRYPIKLLETLMKAFGLIYPEGYGSDFFTSEQRTQLMEILVARRPTTMNDLIEYMRAATRPKGGNTDARGLYSAMAVLGQAAHVHTDGTEIELERLIDFERFFEKREVLYAHLDSRSMHLLSRDVGRLLLFSLLETASQREKLGTKTQAFVAIDEFHRLAARNVVEMLEDARSAGVGFMLAHQSSSSLQTRDADLYGILFENCSFKQCLTLEDPRVIELFQGIAGRVTEIRRGGSTTYTDGTSEQEGWTSSSSESESEGANAAGATSGKTHGSASGHTGGTSKSRSVGKAESWKEEMGSALTPEMITEINDVPLLSLVHVKGVGEECLTPSRGIPILVQGLYPVSEPVFKEMSRALWPLKKVDPEGFYGKKDGRMPTDAHTDKSRLAPVLPSVESSATASAGAINQGERRHLEKRIDTLADKLAAHMLGQPMTARRFSRRFSVGMDTLKRLARAHEIEIASGETELTPQQVEQLAHLLGKTDGTPAKDNGP